MSKESPEAGAEACPVDPATRAAWLKNNSSRPPFPGATPPAKPGPSCDSDTVDQTPPSNTQPGFFSRLLWSAPTPPTTTSPSPSRNPTPARSSSSTLGLDREISTIPRASPSPSSSTPSSSHPANSESESGVSASGNWIYPSEKMFFEAMKRKGYSSEEKDMKTIVPIHNAVNERAWKEIREWERGWGSEKCGGPRLQSFLGLSQTLSPKARINTMLGYTAPFDRHDWVVDRCGTRVDYVIDFYAGRSEGKGDGKLNFFLDVRPKLNTWEGWKMRAWKGLGLS
ncbi:cytochrome c1 heme lyase protein [Rutstroemia sp. NJR-2017a WRK4]|nr:cytochrome c1 heme lyase protein [Rutstroemia sp. NJR-2017a WRK4]